MGFISGIVCTYVAQGLASVMHHTTNTTKFMQVAPGPKTYGLLPMSTLTRFTALKSSLTTGLCGMTLSLIGQVVGAPHTTAAS